MKNIVYFFVILFAISCKGQMPVINSLEWNGTDIPNSYLKDTNDNLNLFEGTYLYSNNDTIFKIKLKKIILI